MTPTTWRISRATRDDAFALAALTLQMDREMGRPVRGGFIDEYADVFLRDFDLLPAWIAKADDGAAVGFVQCSLIRRLPNAERAATPNMHVANLFVIPSARSAGLGAELMGRALDYARLLGCGRVTLNSLPAARSLYERCGFAAPPDSWMDLPLTTRRVQG